jgi:hypothetical protein
MGAKYPYYLLADSPEGIQKEKELTGKIPPEYKTEGDIKKGFVYKRVPHVTLKSIANNPDIHEGMTRQQIDAAIAKHAETETLYDQPYEDNKRVRVCGPFSVESLSPHRVLATDDIACWFIDTDYNGESFFVRHAYFTGADEPYDKLKRALRAEIDEAAWGSLYSTTSRPFAKPDSGKIAVKVINHYGDEVLKVFTV